MQKIVLVPAGLGSLDKTFSAEQVDWSTASDGYVKAKTRDKELTIPLTSILYVESS